MAGSPKVIEAASRCARIDCSRGDFGHGPVARASGLQHFPQGFCVLCQPHLGGKSRSTAIACDGAMDHAMELAKDDGIAQGIYG